MTSIVSEIANDISLGEMLNCSSIEDVTIRFICAARKVMNQCSELSNEEMDLETEISRIYHRIGHDRRVRAFSEEKYRTAYQQPVRITRDLPQKLEPVKPAKIYASPLTVEQTVAYVTAVISKLKADQSTFKFQELKPLVAEMHLHGDKVFDSGDLAVQPNGQLLWEHRLNAALKRLRDNDVLTYRTTKKDYYIF